MVQVDGKSKTPNEKPISLHPLTVEEALRKAMNAPPPEYEPKARKQKKAKLKKRRSKPAD